MTELRPRVERDAAGRIALRLSARERAILGSFLAELRDFAGPAGGDATAPAADPDPAWVRLHPAAIPDDPEAEASFRSLTRADLEDTRRTRLAAVEATMGARTLDEDQATAWMGALTDLRLVLGTRLGVAQDDDGGLPDPADPDAERRIVFAYAGWLLEQFVDALAAGLPDDEPDDEPDSEPDADGDLSAGRRPPG